MTFWQNMLIAGLVKLNVVQATCTYSVHQASDGLQVSILPSQSVCPRTSDLAFMPFFCSRHSFQNFLICIEMLVAAWAHWKYFSYVEFMAPVSAADVIATEQGASADTGEPSGAGFIYHHGWRGFIEAYHMFF